MDWLVKGAVFWALKKSSSNFIITSQRKSFNKHRKEEKFKYWLSQKIFTALATRPIQSISGNVSVLWIWYVSPLFGWRGNRCCKIKKSLFSLFIFFFLNQPTVYNGGVSRVRVCDSADQDQIEVESTYKKTKHLFHRTYNQNQEWDSCAHYLSYASSVSYVCFVGAI